MNENSELLLYIYQNVDTGVKQTTKLLRILNSKDNKIKKIIEGQLKGYENFLKNTEKLLKKHQIKKQKPSFLSDVTSSVAMNLELLKDNSDSKIADMLIKGFTMGNVDIDKVINKYNDDADKKILKLAEDLKKFGETNIELLKEYL